jgi:hypothetical protein
MAAKAYRVIQEPPVKSRFTNEEILAAIRRVKAMPKKDLLPVSWLYAPPKKRRARAKA